MDKPIPAPCTPTLPGRELGNDHIRDLRIGLVLRASFANTGLGNPNSFGSGLRKSMEMGTSDTSRGSFPIVTDVLARSYRYFQEGFMIKLMPILISVVDLFEEEGYEKLRESSAARQRSVRASKKQNQPTTDPTANF